MTMAPKVDQMENPPSDQVMASAVPSGVHRRQVTSPGKPGKSLVRRTRVCMTASPPVISSML